jgi:uncharacterized membrane protein (UPF0127 family)
MLSNKKMISLLLVFLLIVIVIVFFVVWHVLFGKPNPPLPRAQVIVQSSTPSTAVASSTPVNSSSFPAAVVTSPIVAGENGQLSTTTMDIDSAIFDVEIASTTIQKANGLSFRPSLGADQGMLFLFGSGSVQTFWMQSMNFPLDMIWISGNTVVGFAQNVPAPAPGTPVWSLKIYSSPANTDKVLEVNSGTVAKYNIKVGDTVTIN